jgi:hypothetical protein
LKPAQKDRKRQKYDGDSSSHEDDHSSDHSESESDLISWPASSPPGSPVIAVKGSRKRTHSEIKTPKSEPITPSLLSGPTRSRKSITDKIFDIASEDRSHRLSSLKIREQEKTLRNHEKGSIKREIELKRMEFQADQSDKQRAHELRMMELQMQMRMPPPAQLRADVWPQGNPAIDPGLF